MGVISDHPTRWCTIHYILSRIHFNLESEIDQILTNTSGFQHFMLFTSNKKGFVASSMSKWLSSRIHDPVLFLLHTCQLWSWMFSWSCVFVPSPWVVAGKLPTHFQPICVTLTVRCVFLTGLSQWWRGLSNQSGSKLKTYSPNTQGMLSKSLWAASKWCKHQKWYGLCGHNVCLYTLRLHHLSTGVNQEILYIKCGTNLHTVCCCRLMLFLNAVK